MFDRQLFPSLDVLLADLESATGARSNVLIDRLPAGTWGQGLLPSATNPVVLITVAEPAREFQHAIVAWHAHELLRRYEQDGGLVATLNPKHLAAVESEARTHFAGAVPPEKLPGLARILYDGIARQIRSSINGVEIHRRVSARHPDLSLQHRNWMAALIRQSYGFWQHAVSTGGQYPERLVRWNRLLLVLEVVGLARLAGTDLPSDLASSAEAESVKGLIGSILAGDAASLSDQDLTRLACRMAGIPADWVAWVPAAKAWRGPAAPISGTDTIAAAVGDRAPENDSEYTRTLAEADRLRAAGELRAAGRLYGRLLDHGGNADQRVLIGRALAIDQEKPTEAIRLAKLALKLDPSTTHADTASALITRHTGERVHRDMPVRPDVLAYLTEAWQFYNADEAAGKKAWLEVGMLASTGVNDDGKARYRISSVMREPDSMASHARDHSVSTSSARWLPFRITDRCVNEDCSAVGSICAAINRFMRVPAKVHSSIKFELIWPLTESALMKEYFSRSKVSRSTARLDQRGLSAWPVSTERSASAKGRLMSWLPPAQRDFPSSLAGTTKTCLVHVAVRR